MGPDEQLQIMYGTDGRRDLTEFVLPHWEGYRKSYPVRVGNGAQNQLQLDIYGELLDSIYLYDKYGEPISYELWRQLVRLIDWVCQNWDQADEGIWEVRGGRQPFFYSRLMCWVAIDRGLRLAAKRSLPAVERWLKVRDDIYHQIHTEFWNEKLQSFVQTKRGTTLDAASLLAPLVRFISPTDPRWLSTLKAIEQNLVDDSLVYRYRTEDGLTGSEGTFLYVFFLVYRVRGEERRHRQSAIPFREDARVCESSRAVSGRARPVGRASRQFSAGVYPHVANQRGVPIEPKSG
jgi:GH15 family glucan-1,4-alpha-glucosidase